MKAAIFVGPTLSGSLSERRRDFLWLPPAEQGDVYEISRRGIRAIGLIDGRFETVCSVWHKEILWALSKGIRVYGAASLGALRAAELAEYGMIGVGKIYGDYRCGRLSDDDEVAVLHAPAELDYRPLSESLVDIRATLVAAEGAGIITKKTARELTRRAKLMFFKERNWQALLHPRCTGDLASKQISKLASWLPVHKVDQKRIDGLALVSLIGLAGRRQSRPRGKSFSFQKTVYWEHFLAERRHHPHA